MMKRLSAILAVLLSLSAFTASPVLAAEPAVPAAATQTIADTYTQTGEGNAVLENVGIKTHLAAAHITHNGKSIFIVKQTKPDGTETELVNTTGAYDATSPMDTINPSKLQIIADGDWSITLGSGVYWGDTGTKYHIDQNCMSFQGNVPNFGTVSEAQQAGRIGWCQICSDGMGRWNTSYSGAPAAIRSVGNQTAVSGTAVPTVQPAASRPEVPAQSPEPEGKQIYRTKSGKKYHYKNPCGKGTYYPCTLQEALAAGLGPCEKCVN